jgi:hypothetical protein
MIETQIFDTLKGLVSNRVYPLVMPQNPTLPALVYTRIVTNAQNNLDRPPTLDQCLIQIDSYAKTYLEAKQVAEQARDVLEVSALKSTLQNIQDFWEDEAKIYRVTMDFYCWEKRPSV